MTGVSAIQYFSIDIYKQIGIGPEDALKYQAINNILALIAQAMCILFIDKFGRRWPLITGNLINSVMFLIATVLIGESSPHLPSYGGTLVADVTLLPSPISPGNQCERRSWLGLHHRVSARDPHSSIGKYSS